MARNIDRDAREMARRKKQLLLAGFELFSKEGIENVSLQTIADRADVGIATIYNYYKNKNNLVIAISGYIWSEVWNNFLANTGEEKRKNINAYEAMECYLDVIIDIYKTKPEILKFSGNYKTYICRENISSDSFDVQLKPLEPIFEAFSEKYEKAKTDGSIRTDFSDRKIFQYISLTMLGMAERYAQGVVWSKSNEDDYCEDLLILKDMLLDWLTKK